MGADQMSNRDGVEIKMIRGEETQQSCDPEICACSRKEEPEPEGE